MHKYPGVLFLFLIIGLHGSAQKKEAPPGVPKKIRGVDENCQYRPRYSAAQRRNFYPFKGSDSIVLVSFRHHWKNYPVRADSVTVDSLVQQRTLNTQETDELTDLLFNNFYKKTDNIDYVT